MKSSSFSAEKMMGRMFRKVDSVVWDLMSGKLGVRTRDGEIATIEGEGDEATIVINPFEDFGVAIPAFAQNTPVDTVKVGDLIYTSGEAPGWIVSIKTAESGKKTFRIIRPGGNISSWVPPKVQMFGLDGGVLVVRSLLSIMPAGADGGAGALAGLQGSLLPMLMMGGDSFDIEKIMPLMLMSQIGGGAAGANPMAGMMQMMMMSKMMGGGDSLFGGGRTGNSSGPFNR